MSSTGEPLKRTGRLSLTKAQLATAVGAELSQILESTTADGKIDDQEVTAVASWLEANERHGIPAIDHLLPAVRRVLADGVITEAERCYLQEEIERVMPPELRATAKLQRREAVKIERDQQKQEAIQAKQELARREDEERQANGHVDRLDLMVAGVAYDGRATTIRNRMPLDDTRLDLCRMRDNPHDRNAVLVALEDGSDIGFIPRHEAAYLAPLLDAGHRHTSIVKKVLDGGRLPIPVVVIDLFAPDNAKKNGIPSKSTFYRGKSTADFTETIDTNVSDETNLGKTVGFIFLLLVALLVGAYFKANK